MTAGIFDSQKLTAKIKKDPKDPLHYYYRGVIRSVYFNEYESAIQDFSKTIELDLSAYSIAIVKPLKLQHFSPILDSSRSPNRNLLHIQSKLFGRIEYYIDWKFSHNDIISNNKKILTDTPKTITFIL